VQPNSHLAGGQEIHLRTCSPVNSALVFGKQI
jgi:hypothetical protein